MNAELVVIAGQLYRGEYVLALCTHRQDITRVAVHIANRLKSCLVAKKIRQSLSSNRKGGGPEAKNSQKTKTLKRLLWAVRRKLSHKKFLDVWNSGMYDPWRS